MMQFYDGNGKSADNKLVENTKKFYVIQSKMTSVPAVAVSAQEL